MLAKPHPSKEFLRLVFDYDKDRGLLLWRDHIVARRKRTAFPGSAAGTIDCAGYRAIVIGGGGAGFRSSRLIWIWHNGDIQDGLQIDHINGVRDDDRIENLRAVTPQINMRNRVTTRGKYPIGVSKTTKGLFKATVHLDGRVVFLGEYTTELRAAKSAVRYRLKHGFTKRHCGVINGVTQ